MSKTVIDRVEWENDVPINLQLKTIVEEWREIDWKQVERRVYKLQKQIYRASSRGDVKVVRQLQKTLIRSWSAKVLAVRRVTQDNQGKKTAGVDGVKSLSPAARLRLVGQLNPGRKAKPARRVWIPKPGRDEKRPLGIPADCSSKPGDKRLGKLLLDGGQQGYLFQVRQPHVQTTPALGQTSPSKQESQVGRQ